MEKLKETCSNVMESRIVRLTLAFVVGCLLGMLASFTVNCTLVEISMNGYFAVYFGLLFMFIAGIILWRVKSGEHPKPWLLVSFSLLVMFSGLMCFMLEKDWFLQMSPSSKVPIYSILGISVCFAIVFSVIDVINYFTGVCCQQMNSRPIVETEAQVYLVVGTAIIMGFVFGLVFGLLDVEDESLANVRIALMREESICYPIGAIVGGIATVANQLMRERNKDYAFDPLHDTEIDEENF